MWDPTNTDKFSTLAIGVAKDILKNVDEIDELYEWLDKQGRCGFNGEEEVYQYVKHFLCELMIVECQNYIDTSPYEQADKIIERIHHLEESVGELPDKTKVILSLAKVYKGEPEEAIEIAKTIVDDITKRPLYRADACFTLCFAHLRMDQVEAWQESINWGDKGIEILKNILKKKNEVGQTSIIKKQAREILGKILTVKGLVHHEKIVNFKEAEECYKQGLKYKSQSNDLLGCAISNGSLGRLYFTLAVNNKMTDDGHNNIQVE